jgi:ubiquitin-like 1-activating enzyme E1 B
LARETEELKKIKDAIGTDSYAKKVFDKIFTRDIERLLTMDEMWKNRTPPCPLFFDELETSMTSASSNGAGGLKDQHVWSIRDNFNMFKDR